MWRDGSEYISSGRSWLLRRLFGLVDEFLDQPVHRVAADRAVQEGVAQELGADAPPGVQEDQRRPAPDVPPLGNQAAAPVGPPGDPFLLDDLLEFPQVGVAVDADEGKRLPGPALD